MDRFGPIILRHLLLPALCAQVPNSAEVAIDGFGKDSATLPMTSGIDPRASASRGNDGTAGEKQETELLTYVCGISMLS